MGFTRFRKRDANRYRKVYPRIRKTPKFFAISEKTMILEQTKIELTNGTGGSYSFENVYGAIPTIQISAEASGSQGMVNVFLTSLSVTSVTFETSAPFTGAIHIQVIKID